MLIQLADSDAEILNCFPVLSQLRPHLQSTAFVERVRRQMQLGYKLAFLSVEDQVVAIAGFRLSECLAWGKFLYVDDLVVDQQRRSQSYGEHLIQWLLDYAQQAGCEQFHLDSGVQRFDAHRFYFRHRMFISSYHFALNLPPQN